MSSLVANHCRLVENISLVKQSIVETSYMACMVELDSNKPFMDKEMPIGT